MKLATTTSDFISYTSDIFKIMEYIKSSGFDCIDYNFGEDYYKKCGVFGENKEEYIVSLTQKANELEMNFVQAHAPMGEPLADDGDEFVQANIECIKACNKLGIKNLVVHSGYLQNISKKECFEKNKIFYDKLLGIADENDVNILTENFNKMCLDNYYWVDNAYDLLELIEYVNHPRFHAVWDVGHGNLQEMPQDEALRILGHHVYALHVQDNMGDGDSHMAPLFGTTNIDSLICGLKDIGYSGYFTFEATNFFTPDVLKRKFIEKNGHFVPSLDVRIAAERLLCEIGKCILKKMDKI